MKHRVNEIEIDADAGISVYDAIKQAGLMTRDVLAAADGENTLELTAPAREGMTLTPLTFADEAGRKVFRHTASHILAQAVKRLYPAAKLTIGPAIEDGFYYDIDSDVPFTPEILHALEGEMKKIVHENLRLERFTLSRPHGGKGRTL